MRVHNNARSTPSSPPALFGMCARLDPLGQVALATGKEGLVPRAIVLVSRSEDRLAHGYAIRRNLTEEHKRDRIVGNKSMARVMARDGLTRATTSHGTIS